RRQSRAPTARSRLPRTSWPACARTASCRRSHSRSRSTSATSTCGTTTAGLPSTAPSWAARTSPSGTATTRSSSTPSRSGHWPRKCGGHMARTSRWYLDHRLWLEAFALVNLAFLSLDIYLAHSVNRFRHEAEYVPLYFSAVAPVVLLVGLLARWPGRDAIWRDLGYLVGWLAVGIGLVGVVLHLESRFFRDRTLNSLVYAAPFAAPLAY